MFCICTRCFSLGLRDAPRVLRDVHLYSVNVWSQRWSAFVLRGDHTLSQRCFTLDSEIYIHLLQHISQLEIWNYLYSTAHWPDITTLYLIWIYLQQLDIIIHDFSIFSIAKIHAFYLTMGVTVDFYAVTVSSLSLQVFGSISVARQRQLFRTIRWPFFCNRTLNVS